MQKYDPVCTLDFTDGTYLDLPSDIWIKEDLLLSVVLAYFLMSSALALNSKNIIIFKSQSSSFYEVDFNSDVIFLQTGL